MDFRGLGDRWEGQVRERFGKHRQNYRLPTAGELQGVEQAVRRIREAIDSGDSDRLELARAAAEPAGYSLSPLGEDLWLLSEREPRGWGLAVFRPHQGRDSGLVVEVPHPVADGGTPELGWKAFERLDADTFLLAGAHRANRAAESPDVPGRFVSDVTHTRDTPFQAMHEGAAAHGEDVLQVHGFSAQRGHREVPGFSPQQQVVLSDGADDGIDPPHLRQLQEALARNGYRSSIVTFADEASSRLSADTNVQAAEMHSRAAGEFVHLEVEAALRTGSERERQMDRLVDILSEVWPPAQKLPDRATPLTGRSRTTGGPGRNR
ncbi:MAG: hypothetical protein HY319_04405 [Armatimonadetes bacterium]|nr:hypothetical protein [Armatimonadota bacterium]